LDQAGLRRFQITTGGLDLAAGFFGGIPAGTQFLFNYVFDL
jgi:hypothetical protein